jgi:hypothetical protein
MSNLDDVKVGDKVLVNAGRYPWAYRLAPIEHATKLHLVIDGRKYQRKTGYSVGAAGWHRSTIQAYDPPKHDALLAEQLAELERMRKITRVDDIKAKNLTDAQLDAIIAVLDAVPQEATT